MLFGNRSVAAHVVSEKVSEAPLAERRLYEVMLSARLPFSDKRSHREASRFHLFMEFKVFPYPLRFSDAQVPTAVFASIHGAFPVSLGSDQLKQAASYGEFLLESESAR